MRTRRVLVLLVVLLTLFSPIAGASSAQDEAEPGTTDLAVPTETTTEPNPTTTASVDPPGEVDTGLPSESETEAGALPEQEATSDEGGETGTLLQEDVSDTDEESAAKAVPAAIQAQAIEATDAYFRDLTCDGTVQFTWAGYQDDGRFGMWVTANGGEVNYVFLELDGSSGTATLSLPAYHAIAEPGGQGEYRVEAHYNTSGGVVGPTAASATLHTCGEGAPSGPSSSITGLTCTSALLTLNWQNMAVPQTVLRSVSIDGRTIWSESVSIGQESGSLSYTIPPYEEYASSRDSGTVVAQAIWSSATAPNWQTARSTVSGCNTQPPVLGDVRITALRCDQTGSFTWSNVTSADEFILDWQWSDGGPRGQMTVPVTAMSGSWDFVLQSGIGTTALPAANAANLVANPVLSLNVYLDEVDQHHLAASYSALFCDGWGPVDSGFDLTDIACDGTASLSWIGLEEAMGFSVYPSLFPLPEGVELAGETGVAGPGSGAHDIAIDLSGVDGVFDFSLVVTAGAGDEGQDVVAQGMELDCGLIWVDPTDPDNPDPVNPAPVHPTGPDRPEFRQTRSGRTWQRGQGGCHRHLPGCGPAGHGRSTARYRVLTRCDDVGACRSRIGRCRWLATAACYSTVTSSSPSASDPTERPGWFFPGRFAVVFHLALSRLSSPAGARTAPIDRPLRSHACPNPVSPAICRSLPRPMVSNTSPGQIAWSMVLARRASPSTSGTPPSWPSSLPMLHRLERTTIASATC